jgi:hypothetical protein
MFLQCLLAGARALHTPGTIEFYRLGHESKITENKHGDVRRLQHWGTFLIRARTACVQNHRDPLDWFGYRRRLWEVEQDLRSLKCNDQRLLDELRSLRADRTPDWCYHWHRQIERWRAGFRYRVTSRREHRYFKSGNLERAQTELLGRLGYEPAIVNTASWWPGQRPKRVRCAG